MQTHIVNTVHNNKIAFTATINGHQVKMDSTPDDGGDDSAPSPKRLMLASLAGCSGMDVVSILKKMKVAFSEFSISVDAVVADDYPKIYKKVKITYSIKMNPADRPKMEKAISLSQEKYCSVSAMFRSFAEMENEIIIIH